VEITTEFRGAPPDRSAAWMLLKPSGSVRLAKVEAGAER